MGTTSRSYLRPIGLTSVLLSGLVSASCTGASATGSGKPGHRAGSPPATAPVPNSAGIKPQIVGLVDKGSGASYHCDQPSPIVDTAEVARDPAAFSGIVVNETWAVC